MTLKFCGNRLDEDSLQVFTARDKEYRDLETVMSCHPVAAMYYERLAAAAAQHRGGGGGGRQHVHGRILSAEEIRMVIDMLRFVILFALDRHDDAAAAADTREDNLMTMEGVPSEKNQQLLRETKTIDALFLMLSAPSSAGLDLSRLKDEHPPLNTIHNYVLRAIKWSFLGNFRNELYLADRSLQQWQSAGTSARGSGDNINAGVGGETYMKALLHSLRSHEEAATVYQELVSNNKVLLDTKISKADVDIFVNLIRTQGPVAEFLNFMTAICACKGEPLVNNQELMLKVKDERPLLLILCPFLLICVLSF